jgi:hypothetical protein
MHFSISSPSLVTLRAAESSIGRVRSMLRDSMQTLSGNALSTFGIISNESALTDVVSLVKDNNGVL